VICPKQGRPVRHGVEKYMKARGLPAGFLLSALLRACCAAMAWAGFAAVFRPLDSRVPSWA
jgi:hypothetical protein